jgi:hypothetical protein
VRSEADVNLGNQTVRDQSIWVVTDIANAKDVGEDEGEGGSVLKEFKDIRNSYLKV